jgi:hypothetical protein
LILNLGIIKKRDKFYLLMMSSPEIAIHKKDRYGREFKLC